MLKKMIVLATCTISVSAAAQTAAPRTSMLSPNYDTYRSSTELYAGQGPGETPTMRRLKAERARALYAEAEQLLEQDGGTLTSEHEAYLRREACDILGYRRHRSC